MPRRKAKERDTRYSPQDITDLSRPEAAAMLGDELRRISSELGSQTIEQPALKRRASGSQGGAPAGSFSLSVQDSPTIALLLLANVLRADIIPSTTDGYVLTTLAGQVVWASAGTGTLDVLNGIVDFADWTPGVAVDGIYGTPYYYDITHGFGTGEATHVHISNTSNELYPHYRCQPLVQHLDDNTVRLWVYRDNEHPNPRFRHSYGRIRVHYSIVAYH